VEELSGVHTREDESLNQAWIRQGRAGGQDTVDAGTVRMKWHPYKFRVTLFINVFLGDAGSRQWF
jgi:hypothetical protein